MENQITRILNSGMVLVWNGKDAEWQPYDFKERLRLERLKKLEKIKLSNE